LASVSAWREHSNILETGLSYKGVTGFFRQDGLDFHDFYCRHAKRRSQGPAENAIAENLDMRALIALILSRL